MSDDRPAFPRRSDVVVIIATQNARSTYSEARVKGCLRPFGQGRTPELAVTDLLRQMPTPPEDYTVMLRDDPDE